MKQPELGEKISIIRKEKGYTQSDLAEECNVDIRTIQRIETGEVTPRIFTLRIINEKLGTNFDINGNSKNSVVEGSTTIIRMGWIAGIILYAFFPVLILEALSFVNPEISLPNWPVSVLVTINILHIIVVFIFFRSVFFIGKYTKNTLIRIGAVLSVLVILVLNSFKIVGIASDTTFSAYVHIILASFVGISNVVLGIGFVLTKFKKELSIATGAVLIFSGLLYLQSGIAGFLFWSVSLILLIIYMARFEELLNS
jgi:transcriptional regulator with XRE-family HTH domain